MRNAAEPRVPSDEAERLRVDRRADVEYALYYLFKHKGWRARQVDQWSYEGDAQWARRMSVDIALPNEYEGHRIASALLGEDRSWYAPLFEVPKGTMFVTLDLRDSSGKALRLVDGSRAGALIVSALVGAIEEEEVRRGSGLPSLSSSENPSVGSLRRFLYWLFSLEQPIMAPADSWPHPEGERGHPVPTPVLQRLAWFGERQQALDMFVWDQQSGSGLADLFTRYFENSSVFRWFVNHYTRHQLYCAEVHEQNTIVKCCYRSCRDLFERGGLHLPGSPFCYFDAPLDSITMAESSCVSVLAPEGMTFVPNFNVHRPAVDGERIAQGGGSLPVRRRGELHAALGVCGSGKMKERFGGQWLEVLDITRAGMVPDVQERQSFGIATLTKGAATFRGVRATWLNRNGGAAPRRRMPDGGADDTPERHYVIELMLMPEPGPRVRRYLVVLALCAALFLINLLNGCKVTGGLSTQTVMSLVPIATLFIASFDGAGYIRRTALRIPTITTYACVIADVALLLAVMLLGARNMADSAIPWAIAGLAISAAGLLVCGLWCLLVELVLHSWTRQGNAHDSFEVASRSMTLASARN